jgi:hypothetical protein
MSSTPRLSHPLAHPYVAVLVAAPLLALAGGCDGCSDDEIGTASGSGASGGGGPSTVTGAGGAGDGGGGVTATVSVTGAGGGCDVGTPCDGGTCDETGACCPNESLCGTTCCDAATVCAFGECVTPGEICFDDAECSGDTFCDFSLGEGGEGGAGAGCPGGSTAPEGKCMPRPPICPDGTEPGDPPSCVASCEYHPEIAEFAPELKYFWGNPDDPTHNVMMTPIVIQLDDDDCDGAITERDIPEIVFMTFDGSDYNNGSGTASTLRAISIVDGVVVEKLAIGTDGVSADIPGYSIAGGDIDGDGQNEIVVCTKDQRVRAYEADGTEKWLSDPGGCFMPSIADLDADGAVEIVAAGVIIDGATGDITGTFPASFPVVSDVDGDDLLDIVTPGAVYDAQGVEKVASGVVGVHAAVGDLDLDGVPEIVTVDTTTHTVSVWQVTGPGTFEIVRDGLDINEGIDPNPCCEANPASAGCTRGGGTPTVARFNEDEFPDVALAGGIGYVVFDGQALMDPDVPPEETRLWLTQTQDCSSAQTGSSVFDFDGDGVAEVVYADERKLHIYAGPTGEPLFETCSTNGTLWEYPVVADVDNDGHADLVVGSNSYSGFTCDDGTKTTGIRIFGDLEGKWVRTRRVWNQHAYHVTNVAESGAIPQEEAPNHLTPGLNNFRQNVQPTGQFAAPDLIVSIVPICTGAYRLRARVFNVGEAPVEPGVPVGFYGASEGSLGELATTRTLYPLTYEDLELEVTPPATGDVYAIVDDGSPPHPWHECRTDNNRSTDVPGACDLPD